MINVKWLFRHPEVELKLLPGMDWLKGFFGHLSNNNLLVENMVYMKEVAE